MFLCFNRYLIDLLDRDSTSITGKVGRKRTRADTSREGPLDKKRPKTSS